jgi:DNA repair exonuclease SbcCD nuclease subunit
MKIAVCSDVHLEFGQLQLENDSDAEVLVLSGDICTAVDLRHTDSILSSAKRDRYFEFFTACSRNFPHVVYILGNHEHYHGDYATSADVIKNALNTVLGLDNIHILDKEVWEHNDYVFVGGTLWTDMNGGDEMTMNHVQRRMNDFQICKNSNRMVSYKTFDPVLDDKGNPVVDENGHERSKASFRTRPSHLSPQDVVQDHNAMLEIISETYDDTPPWKAMVVVGHHAPSKGSEHPRYKHETLMNGAYNSRLEEFILARPGIKLWTHGHTHEDFDYMVGTTRVVCNPRGYIDYEERADRFKLKTFEV